jgi:glycosyltransferase involved in cell wall biosynthesis
MEGAHKLSIIIPAYNEGASIGQTLQFVREITEGANCEVIVIDDGSTDNTLDLIRESGATVIHHPRNKGYGASIKSGLRRAQGDFILTLDADGQHRKEDVLEVMSQMYDYDMVVGERDKKSEAGMLRKLGKIFVRAAVNSLGRTRIYDFNSGLRAFRKDIAMQYIHLFPNGFSYSTTITVAFLHEGYSVKYVPIQVDKRTGKSTVSVFDGFRTLILITRLYMLFAPLRIFIPASLFLFTAGLTNLGFDLARRNVQDITVLILLTAFLTFFFGLIVDQMAHIRREMRLESKQ